MRKHLGWKALVLCAALASASPALAQQQTVNFTIGGFVPRGEDARVAGDVLNEDRTFLVFNVDEFKSATVGAEWLFPIGGFIEGGAGVSFTRRTVPTVYQGFVDNSGNEIEQELRLRRIPIDPLTRSQEWGMRSYQDDSDSTSWGGQNVYDVYSKSGGLALDGTKYVDW